MKSVRGVAALTKEFSGAAGEARVAAEFVRYGFRTAKPYWNNDEIDLLMIDRTDDRIFIIPVQVKAVQFIPAAKTKRVSNKKAIQGLIKQYVERNLALCLAIYRPDTDAIWFINGRKNIIRAYDSQSGWTAKHTAFADLNTDQDVRIYVPYNSRVFHTQWLLPPNDPIPLRRRIAEIKKEMINNWTETMKMQVLWE